MVEAELGGMRSQGWCGGCALSDRVDPCKQKLIPAHRLDARVNSSVGRYQNVEDPVYDDVFGASIAVGMRTAISASEAAMQIALVT